MKHWISIPAFLLTLLFYFPENGQAQSVDQQVNLFTIPNMSTSFCRMPSRETSQDIDAVFFNPAGLTTGLRDGFHFQLNNQFQFIRKGMTTEYPAYNNGESYYPFDVNNFTFPTLYAVWKHNKLAFSLGVYAAMGGGGGASFENLPSAELPIADMTDMLNNLLGIYDDYYRFDSEYGNLDYQYDFVSDGVAFSPGVQLTASYKITDNWAVSGGVRYVNFFSNANGSASNIEVTNPAIGVTESPADYIRYMQEQEGDIIAERDIMLGPIAIDGNELLDLLAGAFDEFVPEADIDIRQNGNGFTPIVNVQYSYDNRIFAVFKYEHRTKIDLKTKVYDGKDGDGIYEDGKVIRSDLPGFISMGVRIELNDRLTVATGGRNIFYKGADWNGRNEHVNRNFIEFTVSGEYDIHPVVTVSGGYTFSEAKVDDEYQNEVDYVLPGHTFAFGTRINVTKNVALEAGLLNTIYTRKSFDKQYEPFAGRLNLPSAFDQNVRNEADGRVMLFSIGASISMPSDSN